MDEMFEILIAAIVIVVSGIVSAAQKRKKAESKGFSRSQAQPRAAQAEKKPEPAPKPIQPMEHVPMEPRVHAHLEPDCETHDQPGSLGEGSMEGKDLCHEEQMASMPRTVSRPAPAAPGITLDWSGENMVKAFVMQEVLKRPCERRGR